MASIHCRWVNCPQKACTERQRGHHCPKQKKLSEFLQEAIIVD
jgi:hypothetical protein